MANSYLTPTAVLRKALSILHQKCNFIGSIDRQYDKTFRGEGAPVRGKFGPDLKIRLPNQYVVRTGLPMSAQEVTETSVTLTVGTVKGVDMYFESVDLALSIEDFSERFIEPAVSVLAANVESDAISMYKEVYNLVDGDGAAFAYTHLSSAREILVDNLTPPSPRFANLKPAHTSKYLTDTKALFHDSTEVEKMYVEGAIGRGHGFQKFYENTLLADHTTGTAVKTTTYLTDINAGEANGSAGLLHIDTGSTTFLKGDVITIADTNRVHPETKVTTGALQKFVVTSNFAGSEGDLAISPSIITSGARQNVTGVADGKAIVKVGAAANELINTSLAYHKQAFAFVTADLPLPKGVDFAAREEMDGISMSIVRDFNISDRQFPCRLDILYGYKAVRPEWAVRIHADA